MRNHFNSKTLNSLEFCNWYAWYICRPTESYDEVTLANQNIQDSVRREKLLEDRLLKVDNSLNLSWKLLNSIPYSIFLAIQLSRVEFHWFQEFNSFPPFHLSQIIDILWRRDSIKGTVIVILSDHPCRDILQCPSHNGTLEMEDVIISPGLKD